MNFHVPSSLIPIKRWSEQLIPNVGGKERLVSAAAGLALLALGRKRTLLRGLFRFAGASLLFRGAKGWSAIYEKMGLNTKSDSEAGGRTGVARVERTIRVEQSPDVSYQFIRNLDNLPKVIESLQSVTELDSRRSHWIAKASNGEELEWYTEFSVEQPGRKLRWYSLAGADVENTGSITFRSLENGSATELRIDLEYSVVSSAGRDGASTRRMEPNNAAIEAGLSRLKIILENNVTEPVSILEVAGGNSGSTEPGLL